MSKARPIVIGVTGGSGSGKTSVSKALMERFKGHSVMLLQQDFYYKDQSHLTFEERLETNYDHPQAFDTDLLIDHLKKLLAYQAIDKPVYNFNDHVRSKETIHEKPRDVIIVEGIMVLEEKALRDLMDIKLYVDTDDDIRIIRRIKRDMKERGRSLDSIIHQYLSVVKPMHEQFIEPMKKYADLIIPEGGENHVAIDMIATKIEKILESKA
ncbi:uridine kinase [Atopobacter sp. AH10]|uniref:uridine kinase n=1 Tax=Atopobacter sp. AH10 TaxID=2315861 RepID=UPI000EF28008|nr:uridine kinase [Atopobacter sp. AH10]RLK62992.1 uridine kinase [Atopobacter sp. AH10]